MICPEVSAPAVAVHGQAGRVVFTKSREWLGAMERHIKKGFKMNLISAVKNGAVAIGRGVSLVGGLIVGGVVHCGNVLASGLRSASQSRLARVTGTAGLLAGSATFVQAQTNTINGIYTTVTDGFTDVFDALIALAVGILVVTVGFALVKSMVPHRAKVK